MEKQSIFPKLFNGHNLEVSVCSGNISKKWGGPGPMSHPLSLLGVFRHHLWASVQGGLFSRASDPAFAGSTNTVCIQTRLKTYGLH